MTYQPNRLEERAQYRYLRNPDPQPSRELDVCDDFMNVYDGGTLDEMIDAVMTAAQPASGGEQ